MEAAERAVQIARVIEQARSGWPMGCRYSVRVRGGCAACDPGACARCGYLFTGQLFTIEHAQYGQRVISDRTVHYLSHGITRYETGFIVHDEPVVAEIDVEELAKYLDL